MLIAIFLAATAIMFFLRSNTNFSSQLIPGTNGAYYLVQARSVLQNGSLAFADTPLVFWLEGALAWIINLFAKNASTSATIAVKAVDSVLPSLIGLPILLLLIRKKGYHNAAFGSVIIILFITLHIYQYMLVSDLQKNALGNVLLLSSLCTFIIATTEKKKPFYFISLILFVLTALTHIGCFVAGFIFIMVYYLFFALLDLKQKPKNLWYLAVSAVSVVALVIVLIMFGKSGTVTQIVNLPAKILSNSWISNVFKSLSVPEAKVPLMEIAMLVANHLIVLFSTLNLAKTWKTRDNSGKSTIISLIVTSLVLSSPLIGMDYAARFFLLSFIPISMLMVVFVIDSSNQKNNNSIIITASIVALISLVSVIQFKPVPAISEAEYKDLSSFKKACGEKHDIVVTKHGLEWWCTWVTKMPVIQQYQVEPDLWREYDDVVYLRSIVKETTNESLMQEFQEVTIPEKSMEIYKSNYLEAFRATIPQNDIKFGLPVAKGMIAQCTENTLKLLTRNGEIKVIIDENTEVSDKSVIQPGNPVEVWGENRFFVTDIYATKISLDPHPMKHPEKPMRP